MEFFDFATRAFDYAKKEGCASAEAYSVEDKSFSVRLQNSTVDSYQVSTSRGMNLRVEVDGKNGYAYTEKYEDADKLVARAVDNARTIEAVDECPMQGIREYQNVEAERIRLMSMTENEKLALAHEYNDKALEKSELIERVAECGVVSVTRRISIMNTLGLHAEQTLDYAMGYAGPVAKQGDDVQVDYAFKYFDSAADADALASDAVEGALARLGASPVESGKYRIVLKNGAMASLLNAFSPMFSSEQAQRDLSLLKNKEGQAVAAECVSIVDDPFYKLMPRAFDDEGTPSQLTPVIEKGVLKTLLYNLKTARKAGCETTANAGRSGAAAPVSVAPTNLYIKPGEASYDELLNELKDGLVINDLGGLHAGLNTVSGEFSLTAKGQLIKDGKVVRAVEQITVAGSFIELMKNVEKVGGDIKFDESGLSLIGSPSLLIKEIMVAGA